MVALDPPEELRNDHEQDDDEEGGDVKEEQPLEEAEVGRHARPKLSLDSLQGSLPQFQRVEQLGHTSLQLLPALQKTSSDIFNNNNKVVAIVHLNIVRELLSLVTQFSRCVSSCSTDILKFVKLSQSKGLNLKNGIHVPTFLIIIK